MTYLGYRCQHGRTIPIIGLIYINTRLVDRITTIQSEALSIGYELHCLELFSWPPALKKPVKSSCTTA
jgi:hypothetical protein